jgi:hypothetical protein
MKRGTISVKSLQTWRAPQFPVLRGAHLVSIDHPTASAVRTRRAHGRRRRALQDPTKRHPLRTLEDGMTGPGGIRLHPEAAFVQQTVVGLAEEDQVVERRRTTVRPVADVVAIGESGAATREAAGATCRAKRMQVVSVPDLERSPEARRNRARPGMIEAGVPRRADCADAQLSNERIPEAPLSGTLAVTGCFP